MHRFVYIFIGILIIKSPWPGVESTNIEKTSCAQAKLLDSHCSTYCYNVVKPMLQILKQCQVKDDEMKLLKDVLVDLRQQLAVHKEREAKNKELLSLTSRLDGLSKQIEQLSNTRDEELRQKEEKEQEKEREREYELEKQAERAHICSHDEGFSSWQVIQRRRGQDNSTNFYRPWRDYRDGFGDTNSSFFIGLEKLHQLTKKQPHELIVQMQHFNEIVRYARYDNFAIGKECTQYKLLSLGRHSGNASDAMRRSETMKFTTLDRDNDKHNFSNCAQINQDAWWHAACSDCNLNGIYNDAYHCLSWGLMLSNSDCLKTVQMLVRPKDYCK